jgi:hypothetical protein
MFQCGGRALSREEEIVGVARLLATPVQRLGFKAYQQIRVYNALGSIHEIIDTIIQKNVPEIK